MKKKKQLEIGYKYFLLLKSLLFPYWKENYCRILGTINNPTSQPYNNCWWHTRQSCNRTVEWRNVKAKTEL